MTKPTIAVASATGHRAAHDGDGMLGIYVDGRHPGPSSSLWPVNDLCTCAEVDAPMFTHALLVGGRRRSSISLDATEFPWPRPARENPVIFTVRPSATLVVLSGGIRLLGAAMSSLPPFPKNVGTVYSGWCVGSSSNWMGCPTVGTDVLLARATITVPASPAGVVMLLAKTRVQGDRSDLGGNARLWLTIDGRRRGSTTRGAVLHQPANHFSQLPCCGQGIATAGPSHRPRLRAGRGIVRSPLLLARSTPTMVRLARLVTA